MHRSIRSFNSKPPPPKQPTGIWLWLVPGRGEFEPRLGRTGNLNRNCQRDQVSEAWNCNKKPFYIRVGNARGQYEANPVFWLVTQAGKMDPSCPPEIARFDPAQEKKKLLGAWFLNNVGDRVAKSGRRHSKQRKHKRLSWFYWVTKTDGFLFHLSK